MTTEPRPGQARERPLRVLVVVGIRIWGELLVDHLSLSGRYDVAWAGSVQLAVTALGHRQVDVLLADEASLGEPDDVVQLVGAAPGARLLGLGYPLRDSHRIVAALEAGMSGYVSDDDGVKAIGRAVTTILGGGVQCSPIVVAELVTQLRARQRQSVPADPVSVLTSREREILTLIRLGLTNREIATRLVIEIPTVKNHVHRILAKLGVRRREQAAAVGAG